jgi:hypothetical protein
MVRPGWTSPGARVQPCHDARVRFLSDEWLAALDLAARSRVPPADDPLADVTMTVEQIVTDARSWRLVVDRGSLSVQPGPGPGVERVVRLVSDRSTAAEIAAGRRAALDAFITGDLVIGGDVRPLIEHGAALEALGDLFAGVRAETSFDP